MAIAVETTSTTSFGLRSTLTITKPTGTTENDILIACIMECSESNAISPSTPTVPSGWTLIQNNAVVNDDSLVMWMYYKAATSSEGASYSWSNMKTTAGRHNAGLIIRASGGDPLSPLDQSATDADDNGNMETNVTPTITPSVANTLLIAMMGTQNDTISSFQLTADNPSWTQRFNEISFDNEFEIHTAVRAATSAATLDIENPGIGSGGLAILANFPPNPNAIANATVLTLTSSIISPSISGGSSTTILNPVTATFSINTPTINTDLNVWTNEPLPTPSVWTYEN